MLREFNSSAGEFGEQLVSRTKTSSVTTTSVRRQWVRNWEKGMCVFQGLTGFEQGRQAASRWQCGLAVGPRTGLYRPSGSHPTFRALGSLGLCSWTLPEFK